MVQMWQKDSNAKITCKKCTIEQQERAAATTNEGAAKKMQERGVPAEIKCGICATTKPAASFSNNNLKTGLIASGKSKCKQCVLDAEKNERDSSSAKKQAQLEELREKARIAEASGDKIAALKALSEAAAFEASISTGVKVRKPPPKRRR